MPTMKDVAALAGVSVATVSATMSGRTYVSPELQERVRVAVKELEYRPNAIASNLKRGRSSLIGIIIPDITNPFYTEFVAHVQSLARKEKLSVTLGISDWEPEREEELVEFMAYQHAESLIVCSCGHGPSWGKTLTAAAGQTKLLLADSVPDPVEADSVELDNFAAGELVTRHILSFGHKDVAIIPGPPESRSIRGRVQGYLHAMREAGLEPWQTHDLQGGNVVEGGYEAARTLLASSNPTAIFVCNNQMLIGVMRAIAAANLRVPEDISVASIDDFPWASAFRPTLTTVRQPIEQMASFAFEALKSRMDGSTEPFQREVFAPVLIERNSCGAPSA